jgi:ATP phosphoribosyltransferase regulatory subunit
MRDPTLLSARAADAGLDAAVSEPLAALLDLAGGPDVLQAAKSRLAGTPAAEGVQSLEGLVQWAHESALAPRIFVDLADVRHLAYYTGALFQILAEGPGEPVVSGGRYDGLLARFGVPRPAAGFAVDLDNLAWAVAAPAAPLPTRVLLHGGDPALLQSIARGVRASGVPAVCCAQDGEAYARRWGFSHVADLSAGKLVDLCGDEPHAIVGTAASEVTEQIVAVLGSGARNTGDEP